MTRTPGPDGQAPLAGLAPHLPLAVDVDGTLIDGDLFHLGLRQLLRSSPGRALACLARWPTGGRAAVKAAVAQAQTLDMRRLPVRQDLLALLQHERAAGRPLVLATAADSRLAQALAAQWPSLFDTVLASSPGCNLKGVHKARALQQRFPQGYAYAGDSAADLPVWAAAAAGLVVHARPRVWQRAHAEAQRRGMPLWHWPPPGQPCGGPAALPERPSAAPQAPARGLRFVFWGALAAATNAGSRALLNAAFPGLPFAAAVVLAHGLAMVVAFSGYRWHVWPGSSTPLKQQLLGFCLVNGAAGGVVLAVAQGSLWIAGHSGLPGPLQQAMAHVAGLAAAAAFSYWAHPRLTFAPPRRPASGTHPQAADD